MEVARRLVILETDEGRDMGWILRTIEYLATGGQSERLREIGQECEVLQSELRRLLEVCKVAETRFKARMEGLGQSKKHLHKSLKKAAKLLGRASRIDMAALWNRTPPDLLERAQDIQSRQAGSVSDRASLFPVEAAIKVTVDQFDIAVSAAAGTAVGAAAGLGSWALVSAFGTASTGAAIAGLGGIAAHNAALAWFGGGALAAGGGGMAAGAMVLGGIVAIPVLLVTIGIGYQKTKKKAEELQKVLTQLKSATSACRDFLLVIEPASHRAETIFANLASHGSVFESRLASLHRCVYPIPLVSFVWRWLRQLFTGRYFLETEIDQILGLSRAAIDVIVTMDQPIFDAAE